MSAYDTYSEIRRIQDKWRDFPGLRRRDITGDLAHPTSLYIKHAELHIALEREMQDEWYGLEEDELSFICEHPNPVCGQCYSEWCDGFLHFTVNDETDEPLCVCLCNCEG